MWDTFDKPIENLRKFHTKEEADGTVEINQKAALATDPAVIEADFLFVDPPGIHDPDRKASNKDHPDWNRTMIPLLKVRQDRPSLLWLPHHGLWDEHGNSKYAVDAQGTLGWSWTQVRWLKRSQRAGCVLIYKLPPAAGQALRKAVENVTCIAGWKKEINGEVVRHS